MILIDSILLDEEIIQKHFACDLNACKGACCTVSGGEGAPLKKEEIPLIQDIYSLDCQYYIFLPLGLSDYSTMCRIQENHQANIIYIPYYF